MLHQKKTLSDFKDRDLLMLILTNQVVLFRELKYIRQELKNGKSNTAGKYSDLFKDMISQNDSILKQIDKHLNQEDENKRFLKL